MLKTVVFMVFNVLDNLRLLEIYKDQLVISTFCLTFRLTCLIEKVGRVCSAHAATGVQPEHGPVIVEGHCGLGGFGTDTLGIIVRSATGNLLLIQVKFKSYNELEVQVTSANDEGEEWFSKYMKYKRHEETRITCLLQLHFVLSNIAGYYLAQDKIIYLWDVQRRTRTIEAEKEKKRQQVKEAALASNTRCSLNIH